MFANQTIFNEKADKNKPEDVTDAVRPASKPASQGMVAGFSLHNNQNMKKNLRELLTTPHYRFPLLQNL